MNGVLAAGHPLTAEAGAGVLRAGGNAVDAAVAAVLASFAVESPLTGFGAGGYMMVHHGEETVLIDFFVAAPGLDGAERRAELVPVPVHFDRETVQTFYVGPASCGVPGTAAGLERALARFGSAPLSELVGPGVRLAREGAAVNAEQAYILDILAPIQERLPGTRELYAPGGGTLREGETFHFPELAEALERFGAEGAEPFYRGEIAARLGEFVVEQGGTLGRADFAAYEAVERKPIHARFRGAEVLTNPPPSSGGILIAFCLGLLERLGSESGPEQLVAAMDAANRRRGAEFAEALYEEGMDASFLDPAGLDLAAADLLGSTTHISVLDGDGMCASVTCSNGSGSGVLVPGTGVILNNMLGEEDLNPLGFHRIAPGRRVPSMMAPTVVLRDGEIVLGVGSAGSNRIRSAILQTVVRAIEQRMPVAAAVEAPRLHFEQGVLQAEPGIDEAALARLEARGVAVARRPAINLFFGGVQAVSRDPGSGRLGGGGDPRRGGAVAYA
jgi:gamma-glutamyltranspeptidase / glutathione hydrolase